MVSSGQITIQTKLLLMHKNKNYYSMTESDKTQVLTTNAAIALTLSIHVLWLVVCFLLMLDYVLFNVVAIDYIHITVHWHMDLT